MCSRNHSPAATMILVGREGREFEADGAAVRAIVQLARDMGEDKLQLPGLSSRVLEALVALSKVFLERSAAVRSLEALDPSAPVVDPECAAIVQRLPNEELGEVINGASEVGCEALVNLAAWAYSERVRAQYEL